MRVFLALFVLSILAPCLVLATSSDPFLARIDSEKKSDFCDAGSCNAFGLSFSCGVIQCKGESTCGCSCLIESGAAYPKGYCGDEDPYSTMQKKDQKGVILKKRSSDLSAPQGRASHRTF